MFTYRCPGCGKQHAAEKQFEQDFETKCLRCGATIQVTKELIHAGTAKAAAPASPQAITADVPAEAASPGPRGPGRRPGQSGGDDDSWDTMPLQDLDGSGADNGGTGGSRGGKQKTGRGNGKQKEDKKKPRRGEEEETEEDKAEDGDKPQEGAKPRRPRWQIIAAVAAVVLVVGGASGYLLFGGKKTPPKTANKAPAPAKPKTKPRPTPTTKKPEPQLAAEPKPKEAIRLSAVRLSAELAADAEATNRKYQAALLEVSGLFDRIDNSGINNFTPANADQAPPAKAGAPPAKPPTQTGGTAAAPAPGTKPAVPVRPSAFFAVGGRPVCCELPTLPAKRGPWDNLQRRQPMTVRGTYERDGYMHTCALVPFAPSADARYKGKEVELSGFVERALPTGDEAPFPTITLERETNSLAEVVCLFRKDDEEQVKKVAPGTHLTIRGTCNGRFEPIDQEKVRIRIDNCEFIYTSAPAAPTPRLDMGQFVREYEEDLRDYLPPLRGKEPRVETPLTVAGLAREVTADKSVVDKKYLRKLINVSGRVAGKVRPRTVVLVSGDTDKPLQVHCRFSMHNYRDWEDGKTIHIRGSCTGMNKGILQLDNCEPYDGSGDRDPRRLTADYLPHVPGRKLIYDIAEIPYTAKVKPKVIRQVHYQEKNGLTKVLTTHAGTLESKSLFDAGEPEKWFTHKKTKAGRLPGTPYLWRQSGGFVEQGQQVPTREGKLATIWQPVLKVGARTGDKWSWAQPDRVHDYKLVRFDEHLGRPSVEIEETITRNADPHHPVEVRHVYVQDVGEVEARRIAQVVPREKRTVAEKRLVENPGAGPSKDSKGEQLPKPAPPPRPGG